MESIERRRPNRSATVTTAGRQALTEHFGLELADGIRGITPPYARRPALPRGAVVEVDRAVAEPALVDELEGHVDAVREGALAASDDHGHLEKVVLVDQPGPDRLGGELGPTYGEVAFRRRLQLSHRLGVEVAIDVSPRAGWI